MIIIYSEITISYNALRVLGDVAFLATRFSSLILWTKYALHSGFRPSCLLVGASPEVLFSISLAVLYESLVKWCTRSRIGWLEAAIFNCLFRTTALLVHNLPCAAGVMLLG
ncbi:hypothetical protein YC2023_052058 [Brassica napus]|uniref:(rape) hypothetical protein n=1 Tax=Brassica napus TaxID=3708 RepID=A0A816JX85_BRANA|nr:unnamed protein product [Brassica napus]